MRDFVYQELSGTAFNGVEEVGPAGTLYEIDPTQRELLAWVKSVTNNDVGAKGWHKATAGTCLSGNSPVESTLNREPTRNLLKQVGLRFPAIAIWPEQAAVEPFTLYADQITTSWSMVYMLGPLNEADFARVGAMLRIFSKLFTLTVDARCHGEHDGGALQFDVGQIPVSNLQIRSAQYGTLDNLGDGQDGLAFHAVKIGFDTVERSSDSDGADASFDDFSVAANSVDDEGSWIVAEGKT